MNQDQGQGQGRYPVWRYELRNAEGWIASCSWHDQREPAVAKTKRKLKPGYQSILERYDTPEQVNLGRGVLEIGDLEDCRRRQQEDLKRIRFG